MRIGYLLTPKDVEEGNLIKGCDFILSSIHLSTEFPQDFITDYKNPVLWERRSSDVFDTIQRSENKQLRVWIPAVDLIYGGWEINQIIAKSTIDIIFFGSINPPVSVKDAIKEINTKKRHGNIYYAPLVVFEKHIIKLFDNYWNDFLKSDLPSEKSILAIIPDKSFITYFEKHPEFCDELILWNRPEELKSELLEVIERNKEMTKKKVTGTGKKIQVSIKGIIAIGPLSVRKSPDPSSRTYKVLPKGIQLSFRKIEEITPGMTWGMVNEEEWVLISNGTRKFVILDK